MSAILLPEVVIYNTLESIVKLLREDLAENREDGTILYELFGVDEDGKPLKMNAYKFFQQAKKIIQTPENLNVTFGYNQETAKQVSLAILLPGEQGGSNIGGNEGYQTLDLANGMTQEQFTTMYDCTYQVLISGYNSAEVNLVYNILKSMLLMVYEHLEFMGLRIPVISGNDVVMQDDITPVPVWHKALNLTFKYELTVPKLFKDKVMKGFWQRVRICDPFEKSRCVPVQSRKGQI